jgi:hypothetical protein
MKVFIIVNAASGESLTVSLISSEDKPRTHMSGIAQYNSGQIGALCDVARYQTMIIVPRFPTRLFEGRHSYPR